LIIEILTFIISIDEIGLYPKLNLKLIDAVLDAFDYLIPDLILG
jgi:hypothetical protein